MATIEEMEEVTHGCCGITLWLPKLFLKEKRETGGDFYCPNGHVRVFKKTTAERLREELDGIKRDLATRDDKLAKLKTGKCPWCWKTVKNLSAHIARNHA